MTSIALTSNGVDVEVDYMVTAKNWKYIHWGTGGNRTPAISDTALTTPGTEARVDCSASGITKPSTGVYQVIGEITCNATSKNIDEAGLFNASTGVTMLIDGVFTDIPVVQDDKIQFTFKLTFTGTTA